MKHSSGINHPKDGLFALLLVMAALLSVGFALWGRQTNLCCDAGMYFQAARHWVNPVLSFTAEDGFNLVRAPWYVLFLSGSVLAFHTTIAYLTPVRLLQALLYVGNVALIYHITRLLCFEGANASSPQAPSDPQTLRYAEVSCLKSRWLPFIAGCIYLLYLPFLQMAGRVLTETQTTLFLLLFMFFWLRKRPILCGLLLFLGFSNSWFSLWPKAILLVCILVFGLICRRIKAEKCLEYPTHKCQAEEPVARSPIVQATATFFVLALLLSLILSQIPHLIFGGEGIWTYADTLGWKTQALFQGQLSFLLLNHEPFSGLQQQWQAVLQWISVFPRQFFVTLFVNLDRIFAFPDILFHALPFGFPPEGILFLHRLILLGALVGFYMTTTARSLHKQWRCLFLLPAIWMLYAIYHAETRYNLPIMPFLLIVATLVFPTLLRAFRDACSRLRVWISLVLLSLWYLLVSNGVYGLLLQIIPGMNPTGFHSLQIAILWLALLCFLFTLADFWDVPSLAAQEAINCVESPMQSQTSNALPCLPHWIAIFGLTTAMILPGLAQTVLMPTVMAWKAPIPRSGIQKTIHLAPSFFQPGAGTVTYLVLDTWPIVDSGQQPALSVTINGLSVKAFSPAPSVMWEMQNLLGGLQTPADIRQYRYLPLSAEVEASMLKTHQAIIQIRPAPRNSQPIWIFGDYPAESANHSGGLADHSQNAAWRYWIPSPDWGIYSIFKAYEDGDGRLPVSVQANSWSGKGDLSVLPGLQTGQYRILLYRLLKRDVQLSPLPTAGFYPAGPSGKIQKIARLAY
jgi:hypothetical protein